MTARADRDLQRVLSEDGKTDCLFDKARATEHRTERATGFDHRHLTQVWITEYGNHVRCIEPVNSKDFHWQKISASHAHIIFSERGDHHLVTDDQFKKILI